MSKPVLDAYNRYIERLNFYRSFGYDLEKEREFIIDNVLPISGKILEIGTGKGHFCLALAKRGFSLTSIDICPEDQEFAKLILKYFKLDKQVNFRIENAERISFPDNSFDLIFSINVYHHLENHLRVLEEINRLLKNGARIIFSDFTAKGFEIINKCHEAEGKKHDKSKNNLEDAKEYLLKHKYKLIQVTTDLQKTIIAQKPD